MGFSISPSAFLGTRTTDGTGTAVRVLLALAPVVLPTASLFLLKRSLARRTVATARISPPDPLSAAATAVEDEHSVLPPHVRAEPGKYVVARERVTSRAVSVAALRREFVSREEEGKELEGLLEAYLSATMRAFSWTPQALLMARMGSSVADPAGYQRTFDAEYLGACEFRPGDRVCGVYVVRMREGGRVVLDLRPPEGWTGPVVTGALDVGYVYERGEVTFVNETVMWRSKEGGKPTMLEGSVGRWLHTLMASWLVVKGVEAVTDGKMKTA
ncbi:hypothetical protein GGS26DRAFT_563177 [Hypomontagnella submonticulosa]|nr:hypothetical protein GGS26DRAFT_563177 [Hypomontagnella submonticulosa]